MDVGHLTPLEDPGLIKLLSGACLLFRLASTRLDVSPQLLLAMWQRAPIEVVAERPGERRRRLLSQLDTVYPF